ncbi:hypothetical protein QJS10_CPA09g01147 [Acorus calamus]|uniref:Uncharacterized protein n=1 Tax=Acorus calamus TaxID=4465 RepID=A0AAV9E7F9_ACOCL|nr:hypothetical protein QJS10_CPA09g01147 [Acorus calamus]
MGMTTEETVLPMQEMGMTTEEVRKGGFHLLVVFGGVAVATGEVYMDDDAELEMGVKRGRWSLVRVKGEVDGGVVRVVSNVENGWFALMGG